MDGLVYSRVLCARINYYCPSDGHFLIFVALLVGYKYFRRYYFEIDNACVYIISYLCADGILSYSMPQGDKRSPEWEFYDSTYDGYWDDELQRGLGQLTDGKVGPDNFRMGYYDTERGIVFET